MSQQITNNQWQATASWQALEQRAETLQQIRQFFSDKGVLEVETPVLMRGATTDVYLDSIQANVDVSGVSETLYFQTSPEFALKRLVATHKQSVYQIAKAFRNGEAGNRHNPEFTMLEWYRPGMSFDGLMKEVAALVSGLLGVKAVEFHSYRELFSERVGVDPFACNVDFLQRACLEKAGCDMAGEPLEACLDLLMSHCVEPDLGHGALTFVYDFPAGQAALSKIHEVNGVKVARRFELYVNGSELANGYDELLDAKEQEVRFKEDNQQRKVLGKSEMPWDEKLVQALGTGLPECCGVALGIERLLMVRYGYQRISDVMAFPFDVV
jgi:lysyl-tRNA synthetase class 2